MKPIYCVMVILILAGGCASPALLAQEWKELEPGFWFGQFSLTDSAGQSVASIVAIKADPRYCTFRLLSSSEFKRKPMTAKEWCAEYNLSAAVNAGMFQTDTRTSAGFFKNYEHVNNAAMNSYNCVVAFNPVDSTLPPFKIIDRQCDDFSFLKTKYHCLVQNLRVLDCHVRVVWAQQNRRYSMAVIGEDSLGQMLLVFCRTPHSVHDLAKELLRLPLAIRRLAYLEGGPVASLYVAHNDFQSDNNGLLESGFLNKESPYAWELPLIIGISRKKIELQ